MIRLLGALAAIVLMFIWLSPEPTPSNDTPVITLPPTTSVQGSALQAPIQIPITQSSPHQLEKYTLYPKAEIHFSARLLSKEYYRFDRESDLSPVDLALGWGQMANPTVTNQLTISQSGRWFRWKTDQLPIPRKEIEISAANVHIIPANNSIKDQISDIKEGEMIRLSGQLVNIKSDDGFYWNTSLTREDTGGGACEILYTTHVERLPDPFQ
jgi:hypothetical protein